MKLIEKYKDLKSEYENDIVLLKSGIFYVSFSNDATILNNLLGYQINDDKVGFPLKGINNVLLKSNENHINIYVFDEYSPIIKVYDDNKYQEVLYNAKKNYFNDLNAKLLLEEIKFVIESNPQNIYKIKEFISEL